MHFLFFVSAFTGFLIRTGQAGIQEFKVSNRSNVTAGEPTQVTLLLGEDAPEAKYQIFNYTVGLYSAAGNWPICACFCKCCLRILVLTMNPGNLISLPMTQTVFNITIPPSIGPTGYLYRLWIRVYASNGQQLSTDGERYTPSFYLSGGTGKLTTAEVIRLGGFANGEADFYGNNILQDPILNCEAYDCSRQCAKDHPSVIDEPDMPTHSSTLIYDSLFIACLEECPGVPTPLPVNDRTLTTTYSTSARPTGIQKVEDIVPDATCDVSSGKTSCGRECCDEGVSCFYWNHCSRQKEQDDEALGFTASGGNLPTATTTPPLAVATTATLPGEAGLVGRPNVVLGMIGLIWAWVF